MKQIILIALLAASLSTSLSPLNNPTQAYEHHETFLKKVDALNLLLASTYGKDNPFCQFTTIAELTAEIHEKTITLSAKKKSTRYQEHSTALYNLLLELDHSVSSALETFLNNKPRHHAFRQLSQVTHKASDYIATHLPKQARHSKAMRQITRSQKRFLGALGSIGIFGGAFKYVVIGIVSTAVLGALWKIYRALTKESRNLNEQIQESRKKVTQAASDYSENLVEYIKKRTVEDPYYHIESQEPSRSCWGNVVNKLSCCFTKKYRNKHTNKYTKRKLAWAVQIIKENPNLFGISSKKDKDRIIKACVELKAFLKK